MRAGRFPVTTHNPMTNAFSPSYKPAIDMTDERVSRKISETRSRQRQTALRSSDPEEVKKAMGNLGKLSKRGGRKG